MPSTRPDEVHRVPLQALRRVQRRQRDALHRRAGAAASARASSSAENRRRSADGSTATSSSASSTSASSDSHCARWAAPPGGSAVSPTGSRTARTTSGNGSPSGPGPRRADGGHGPAHLRPGEEPLPAPHLVRHPDLGERLLVDLRLRVDPEQHRDLGGRRAVVDQPPDRPGDGRGLGGLVVVLLEPRVRPRRQLPDQLQARARDPPARGSDQRVRRRDDLRGGAVVARQAHHGGVGEPAREVEQVPRVGAGEGVDRLVRVADDRQVVAAAEPGVEHPLLQRRDVLVLVDDEAAVAVAELLGDAAVLLQGRRGVQQQVVEVEQLGAVLELLVTGVDGGDLLGGTRDVAAQPGDDRRVVAGRDQARLGPLDLAGEVAQRRGVGARASAGRGLADEPQLALQELPLLAADDLRPEVAQLAQRGGVERARLHPGDAQHAQAGAHLPRCAGGERDGEDLPRSDVAGADQVGDPPGDGAGLAGAGPREHAHRPAGRGDGRALLVVQAVSRVFGGLTAPPGTGTRGRPSTHPAHPDRWHARSPGTVPQAPSSRAATAEGSLASNG